MFPKERILEILVIMVPSNATNMWMLSAAAAIFKLTHCLEAVEVKGKSVPLQAWSGPEGSRKLRFPDFTKTAQDGGKVVSLTHRPPLPTGHTPGTQFC
jgi:hypothetical protein